MELQSGQVVRYVSAAATEVDILSRGEETSDILKAIEQHSDLIPHVYEGKEFVILVLHHFFCHDVLGMYRKFLLQELKVFQQVALA